MKDENYYLDLFKEYRKMFNNDYSNEYYLNTVKREFKFIIEHNKEHLLTNSFIFFISSSTNPAYSLELLNRYDIHFTLGRLRYYYESVISLYRFRNANLTAIVDLLDGDNKTAVTSVIKCLDERPNVAQAFKSMMKNYIIFIISYCHYINRLDIVPILIKKISENYNKIVDDIFVNDLYQNDVKLLARITTYVNDEIKGKRAIV